MANGIKIGNLNISSFKVGSGDCTIYLGDTLMYEPTPPPSFQGKWLATYSDSHTESAECDSSSAITDGEINLADLVSVEIGDCVTSIGDNVFRGCISLTSVTVNATTPTSLGFIVFDNTNDCPIYVPAASVSAYQSAWSVYANRIQPIPNS